MKRRKKAKMSYIWFSMHWLSEHTPKSANYQFAKFAGLTVRNHREGAKIILKLLFLNQRQVWMKNERALSTKKKKKKKKRKVVKMTYIWLRVHWLAEHAPKSVKYIIFTDFGRLTGRDLREVVKIISNLHFLTRRWVLRKT